MPTDTTKPAGGAERTPATPPITAADLQEGDSVTILAKVLRHNGNLVAVALHGASRLMDFWVHVDSVATHTPKPRPLAIGDKVRLLNGSHHGELLAIHEDRAWIKWLAVEARPFATYGLDALERVQ